MDENKSVDEWLQRKWRPAVAVTYIIICSFDFIIFPITWAIFLHVTGNVVAAWDPLTLKGAGLFHASFGAILGVAAYTRGQEKLQRVETYRYARNEEREPRIQQYEEPRRSSGRYEPPL